VNTAVLNLLACPVCHTTLVLRKQKRIGVRIISGNLYCDTCGKTFPIKNGIVCFTASHEKLERKKLKQLRQTTILQELTNRWQHLYSPRELRALKKEWNWMLTTICKEKNTIHLDFATGTGRFLRFISSYTNGELVALEHDYATCTELLYFLKKIKKYDHISIVCADACAMPFVNNAFNSVSSWHGLDEPFIQGAIQESQRVLKKHGYFIGSGIHYQKKLKSFILAKKTSILFTTKESILRFLKTAKFYSVVHKIFFVGQWNEKEDYLPIYGDFYSVYGIKAKKK
jgi:uncharacterized protein YbaR (Trm112 family)/ubiquinone/menaquinone biosynthesis C-methylase UbiE